VHAAALTLFVRRCSRGHGPAALSAAPVRAAELWLPPKQRRQLQCALTNPSRAASLPHAAAL